MTGHGLAQASQYSCWPETFYYQHSLFLQFPLVNLLALAPVW